MPGTKENFNLHLNYKKIQHLTKKKKKTYFAWQHDNVTQSKNHSLELFSYPIGKNYEYILFCTTKNW